MHGQTQIKWLPTFHETKCKKRLFFLHTVEELLIVVKKDAKSSN